MAELIVNTGKIVKNIEKIDNFLSRHDIQWSIIVKVLSGNRRILKEILFHPSIKKSHSVGDSRLSNLKVIKSINPDIRTMYIKPPAVKHIKSVVKYADISLNTSYQTIEKLNEEAGKIGKKHSIIIMIEMGELREGIMRENVIDFYQRVFDMDNIDVIGVGTNLGCMYGVEPTYDKLIQLVLYRELLEAKFKHNIQLISGGSSVTLPLVSRNKIPSKVNHFRIGEAVFLGTSPFTNKKFRNLSVDAFQYNAHIIELEKKSPVPEGNLIEGNVGHYDQENLNQGDKIYRAILDFGILDVDVDQLIPKDRNINFIGTTSDMTVYDVGISSKKSKYKVGDNITFNLNYMSVARLMNSKYIEKIIL